MLILFTYIQYTLYNYTDESKPNKDRNAVVVGDRDHARKSSKAQSRWLMITPEEGGMEGAHFRCNPPLTKNKQQDN